MASYLVVTFRTALCSALLALIAACASPPSREEAAPKPAATPSQEAVVPAEALNPDVRQETIHQTICVPGYTASVRPSTTYTNGVKLKLLRERGLPPAAASAYELDHKVPLALGGHPRSLRNLELQPWEGNDGAKKKDQLERKLQGLVCSGKVQLDVARRATYLDWQGTQKWLVEPSSAR